MRTALYIIGWFQSGIVADDVVGLQSGSPRDLPFDAWQIRLGILFVFVFSDENDHICNQTALKRNYLVLISKFQGDVRPQSVGG